MNDRSNQDIFLSIVSHELRTPLTSILGFSDHLLSKFVKNELIGIPASEMEKHIKHLRIVYNNSELLLNIINNILDLVKVKNKGIVLTNVETDPEKTIEEVVDSFAEITRQKGIGLVFGCHSMPKTVKIDKTRLKQILTNIVGNSVKFTNVGFIVIDAELKDDNLIVVIRDTGVGMNQKTIDNLYVPFYQEDTSDTRKFGGVGLGLSITKQLIDLMGGTITIHSEKLKGTSVAISVPITLLASCDFHTSNVLCISQEIRMNLFKKKIIAISSEAVEVEYLNSLFFNYGAEFRTVENSAKLINVCVSEQWIPDIVLMDFNEQLGSANFINLLKSECSGIKFVAYSSEILENPKEKAKSMGFDAYIQKPGISKEFFDTISSLL